MSLVSVGRISVDGFDGARHRADQAFKVAAQHGDQAGVPVLAAVGIFKPVLALPAKAAPGIASKPEANLVHALVKPLHAGMLACLATVDRSTFSRSAARNPERDGSCQSQQDKQGNTHPPSVGLHGGWLKSAKMERAYRSSGLAVSLEGER